MKIESYGNESKLREIKLINTDAINPLQKSPDYGRIVWRGSTMQD